MATLLKSKTFWAAIAGIITAVGAYLTGEMELATAIQTGIGCLLAIFIRDGIATAK
ncbi:MAG: hypothetical protein KKE05_06350 [Nanoarchaeota archaeon]|nr:hypothetical protein [Nanoarchaeota archaeon]